MEYVDGGNWSHDGFLMAFSSITVMGFCWIILLDSMPEQKVTYIVRIMINDTGTMR